MKSQEKYILLFLSFFLCSCGFKVRPVAPTSSPSLAEGGKNAVRVKYCSPYDPKCPLRYVGYVQGLDPKKLTDKRKIQKIEALHKAIFKRKQKKKPLLPGS